MTIVIKRIACVFFFCLCCQLWREAPSSVPVRLATTAKLEQNLIVRVRRCSKHRQSLLGFARRGDTPACTHSYKVVIQHQVGCNRMVCNRVKGRFIKETRTWQYFQFISDPWARNNHCIIYFLFPVPYVSVFHFFFCSTTTNVFLCLLLSVYTELACCGWEAC